MGSKYRQLAEWLEHGIAGGEYPTGGFLPGERALCERFALSRVTVRSGLNLLVEKRLVAPVAGRGYQVMGLRRQAPRVKTHLIGGLFAGPQENHNFMHVPYQLSRGIERVLERQDYSLLFASSDDELLRERECLQTLQKRGAEGLLVMPSLSGGAWKSLPEDCGNYATFKALYDQGVPLVLLDRHLAGEGVPGVYNDDVAGGAMQVEYMLERGFRRIVFFETNCDRVTALRFIGYGAAMKQAGLEPIHVSPSAFRYERAWNFPGERHEAELQTILPLLDRDTALVCSNFLVPALEKFFPGNRHGELRVEWICYDFSAGAALFPCRPYPCISRPIRRVGEAGALKLLRLLQGDEDAEKIELIRPELIF